MLYLHRQAMVYQGGRKLDMFSVREEISEGEGEMNDSIWIPEYIKKEAEIIREKFTHSLLFGRPIDMNNPDELLFCAYMMGQTEEGAKRQKEFDLLYDLKKAR